MEDARLSGREKVAMAQQPESEAKVRHFRYNATGLRGKRMRLMDDLPTSDAGHPQETLVGHTDVICLDETPNVMHDLRVHPVGHPEVVSRVEFRQLALYDDEK